MNKAQCIDAMIRKITEAEEHPKKEAQDALAYHQNMLETYAACQDMCRENGYISATFEQMWLAAVRSCAVNRGVYRG